MNTFKQIFEKILFEELGQFVFVTYILNITFYLFSIYDYTINYLHLHLYQLLDIKFNHNHSISFFVFILVRLLFTLVLIDAVDSSYKYMYCSVDLFI